MRFALTSEAGLNDGLAFPFVYAAIFLATLGPVSRVGRRLGGLGAGRQGRRRGAGRGGRGLGDGAARVPGAGTVAAAGGGRGAAARAGGPAPRLRRGGGRRRLRVPRRVRLRAHRALGRARPRLPPAHARRHRPARDPADPRRAARARLRPHQRACSPTSTGGVWWWAWPWCSSSGRWPGSSPSSGTAPRSGPGRPRPPRAARSSRSSACAASARSTTWRTPPGPRPFPEERWLWSTVGFTVALSVVLHGILATPVMRRLDAACATSRAGGTTGARRGDPAPH